MSILLWILLALYIPIALLWLWACPWIRTLSSQKGMGLAPQPHARFSADCPSLLVLVAAHNEADRIRGCLQHILSQNYPRLRVRVVNDRSDDSTSDRVRSVMREDDRVDLVEVTDLPTGWIGKTHALARATRDVLSDYMLFVDCDCRLAPGAIAAVMQKALAERLDFVSLWPHLELRSRSEQLLTPPMSWLLGVWTMVGSRGGRARSPIVLGNGQFMLFSRSAYERTGGHGAVQAELAEDAVLARHVAELECPRWIGLGQGLYVTTRDNSPGQTINSLTRVVIGSLLRPGRLLWSTQILGSGVVLPFLLVPLGAVFGQGGTLAVWWLLMGFGIVHILAMHFVLRSIFRMTFEKPPPIYYFFIGSLLNIGVVIRACFVILGRGQLRWGNTAYRVRGSQIVAALPPAGR